MVKAEMRNLDGTRIFLIGLSFANPRKFMAEPGDTYIRIEAAETGLGADILLVSGKDENTIIRGFQNSVHPGTVIRDDRQEG